MTAAELVVDDLEALHSDWRTHLRARNRSKATIASYERCAVALRAFLVSRGMPTSAAAIAREHVEAVLADLADRVAPPTATATTATATTTATTTTTAKHYRSLPQLFRWLEEEGEIPRSPCSG